MKCKDLEQAIRKKEDQISEWQAKCARLEQTPVKVEPRLVEVEDSGIG